MKQYINGFCIITINNESKIQEKNIKNIQKQYNITLNIIKMIYEKNYDKNRKIFKLTSKVS